MEDRQYYDVTYEKASEANWGMPEKLYMLSKDAPEDVKESYVKYCNAYHQRQIYF